MDDDAYEAFVDDIVAYVEDKDGRVPKLADLPAWLRRVPPDCPALAEFTIGCYVAASERHRWAWDGLVRLLQECQGREPELLQRWACDVSSGRRRPGPKPRGTPRKDDENLRLFLMYHALGANPEAKNELETALGWDESTIRKKLPKPAANGVGTQILRDLMHGR